MKAIAVTAARVRERLERCERERGVMCPPDGCVGRREAWMEDMKDGRGRSRVLRRDAARSGFLVAARIGLAIVEGSVQVMRKQYSVWRISHLALRPVRQ